MRVIAAALALLVLQSTPAPALRVPPELDRYLTKYVSLTPAHRAAKLAP